VHCSAARCTPSRSSTATAPGRVGPSWSPSGPQLYAAGSFLGLRRIAKWDGQAWSPLGSGLGTSQPGGNAAFALEVFDEDAGGPGPPALFVAGEFTVAGGVPAGKIARWDGAQWSSVGGGLSAIAVRALRVFDDDGAGPRAPALYAGTEEAFGSGRVVKWDGSAWTTVARVGGGGGAHALAVVDFDGSGPSPGVLVGGGEFREVACPERRRGPSGDAAARLPGGRDDGRSGGAPT
jgi:hypothetical protein